MRKLAFAYAKTKPQTSCAVSVQLISAFVFIKQIVHSLNFLDPKFPASNYLLWLYSLAWFVSDLVENPVDRFSHDAAYILLSFSKLYFRFTNQYITEEEKSSPRASVILHPEFSYLPPTLIILAELDPLRDGGLGLYMSVILHPEFSYLPPTLIILAELDPLRDGGLGLYMSVILHPEFSYLPPTMIILAELDPLRDGGLGLYMSVIQHPEFS